MQNNETQTPSQDILSDLRKRVALRESKAAELSKLNSVINKKDSSPKPRIDIAVLSRQEPVSNGIEDTARNKIKEIRRRVEEKKQQQEKIAGQIDQKKEVTDISRSQGFVDFIENAWNDTATKMLWDFSTTDTAKEYAKAAFNEIWDNQSLEKFGKQHPDAFAEIAKEFQDKRKKEEEETGTPKSVGGKISSVLVSAVIDPVSWIGGGVGGVGSKLVVKKIAGEKAAKSVVDYLSKRSLTEMMKSSSTLLSKEGLKKSVIASSITGAEAAAGVAIPTAITSPLTQINETGDANLLQTVKDVGTSALIAGATGPAFVAGSMVGGKAAAQAVKSISQNVVKPITKSSSKLIPEIKSTQLRIQKELDNLSQSAYIPERVGHDPSVDMQRVINSKRKIIDKVNKLHEQSKLIENDIKSIQEEAIIRSIENPDYKPNKLISKLDSKKDELLSINSKLNILKSSKEYNVISGAIENKLLPKSKTTQGEYRISDFITARGFIYDPDIAKKMNDLPELFGDTSRSKLYDITVKQGESITRNIIRNVARTTEKIDDYSLRGFVKTNVYEPIVNAMANKYNELETTRGQFTKLLSDAGLSRNSLLTRKIDSIKGKVRPNQLTNEEKLSLIFRYGEKRLSDEEKKLISPQMKAVGDFMRGKYDDYLTRMNRVRRSLNLPEIKRRDDYINHIRERSLLDDIMTPDRIDPEVPLGGKPKRIKLGSAEKERVNGTDFIEDPIEAFEAYINRAMNVIHVSEPYERVVGLTRFMKPNNRAYYYNWLNTVGSGIDDFSRSLEKNDLGKKFVRVSQSIDRKMGNILGESVSLLWQQPFTAIHTIAQTGLKESAAVALKMLKSGKKYPYDAAIKILDNADNVEKFVLKRSPEYNMRVSKSQPDLLGNRIVSKLGFISAATRVVDLKLFQHSFLSAYDYGVNRFGMDDIQASRFADIIAGKSQTVYEKSLQSPAMRSKVGSPIFKFQTFTANLYDQLLFDSKQRSRLLGNKEGMSMLAKTLGGMYMANTVAEGLGLPNVYNLPFVDVRTDKKTGLPLPSPTLSTGIIPGSRPSPVVSFWGNMYDLIFDDDLYNKQRSLKEIGKLGITTSFPGANQIYKTTAGIIAASNGSYDIGKNKVKIKGLDIPRSIVFGPNQAQAVKDYWSKKSDSKNSTFIKKVLQ